MFASYLAELALGLVFFAAALGFGWYLFRVSRRASPPLVIRSSGVADMATVLELSLLALGVAYLVAGVMQVLPR